MKVTAVFFFNKETADLTLYNSINVLPYERGLG
jgi:hypothetical protein